MHRVLILLFAALVGCQHPSARTKDEASIVTEADRVARSEGYDLSKYRVTRVKETKLSNAMSWEVMYQRVGRQIPGGIFSVYVDATGVSRVSHGR